MCNIAQTRSKYCVYGLCKENNIWRTDLTNCQIYTRWNYLLLLYTMRLWYWWVVHKIFNNFVNCRAILLNLGRNITSGAAFVEKNMANGLQKLSTLCLLELTFRAISLHYFVQCSIYPVIYFSTFVRYCSNYLIRILTPVLF